MKAIVIKLNQPRTYQQIRSHFNMMAMRVIWQIRDQPDNAALRVLFESIRYCKFKRLKEKKGES